MDYTAEKTLLPICLDPRNTFLDLIEEKDKDKPDFQTLFPNLCPPCFLSCVGMDVELGLKYLFETLSRFGIIPNHSKFMWKQYLMEGMGS